MSEDVPSYFAREFKVGDRVKLKRSSPNTKTVPAISELLAGGYVMLLWIEDDGRQLNSACHLRDLEFVSDGSEPAAMKQD